MLVENGVLGTGDVVLGQLANFLEQGRAFLIVEVPTGQAFRRCGQALCDILGEVGMVLPVRRRNQRDSALEVGLLFGKLCDDGLPI